MHTNKTRIGDHELGAGDLYRHRASAFLKGKLNLLDCTYLRRSDQNLSPDQLYLRRYSADLKGKKRDRELYRESRKRRIAIFSPALSISSRYYIQSLGLYPMSVWIVITGSFGMVALRSEALCLTRRSMPPGSPLRVRLSMC